MKESRRSQRIEYQKQIEQEKLEKQQAQKRRNVVKAGIAGVALLGVAGAGVLALESDKKTQMPKDVASLVEQSQKGDSGHNLKKLESLEYKEVSSRNFGDVRLRIAEVGQAETKIDYDQLASTYEKLISFAAQKPQIKLPIAKVDASKAVVANQVATTTITPVGKNITVLVVPASEDIGSYLAGMPDVFTDTHNGEVLSIVRPEIDQGIGSRVEACQGTLDVTLQNTSDFDTDKLSKVQLLLQEEVCNALGTALGNVQRGTPYANYALDRQQRSAGQGFTNDPNEGSAYSGRIPYLDEAAYNELNTQISLSGDSLIF